MVDETCISLIRKQFIIKLQDNLHYLSYPRCEKTRSHLVPTVNGIHISQLICKKRIIRSINENWKGESLRSNLYTQEET